MAVFWMSLNAFDPVGSFNANRNSLAGDMAASLLILVALSGTLCTWKLLMVPFNDDVPLLFSPMDISRGSSAVTGNGILGSSLSKPPLM